MVLVYEGDTVWLYPFGSSQHIVGNKQDHPGGAHCVERGLRH